ncbi:uncharacterized protein [Palaemon carinicauda]|uniref:uncharacterized protein n=1 Tax=Palaemon carinicauda TaxID=392227 RepID=UPI0035B61EA6
MRRELSDRLCGAVDIPAGGALVYAGANSEAEACDKFNEASKIMAEAGKQLNKESPLNKLDHFLDSRGLLRIKGRLEYSDLSYEIKHPIILPPSHIVKVLVHFQHVLLKHAGVSTLMSLRNSYWIVRLRRLAKAVFKEDLKACSKPIAPLPELRVKSAPPFTVTGLHYVGPLYCADMPSKKLYILLFLCAVVCSVHSELTDSLSLADCLLAIRIFTSRRGIPSKFHSDNVKKFIGASHVLQQHCDPLAPQWKFIVTRAPWCGGWVERLIRPIQNIQDLEISSVSDYDAVIHNNSMSVPVSVNFSEDADIGN